jgi:hypothetical protein
MYVFILFIINVKNVVLIHEVFWVSPILLSLLSLE